MGATVAHYLAMRDAALARGDHNLVREIEHQLARVGWQPETTEFRAAETATPAKAPRARRTPVKSTK